MKKNNPTPPARPEYNENKWGIYGELGDGSNAKVRFIQTVISSDELDTITLVSEIPGSEKWDIVDLFQRNIDSKRVEHDIIPYLQDKSKVKFFNPLTLVVLPMEIKGKEVLKDLEYVSPVKNDNKIEFEKSGYYKLSIENFDDNLSTALIEWNSKKCHIVAIDGQHRLSALKRWKKYNKDNEDLFQWKIPVVILSIFKVKKDVDTPNLLEIVRKTFVYINTTAVEVNRARKILLNDESINSICVQEILQHSHTNSNKDLNNRSINILPLFFYNWRGDNLKPEEDVSLFDIEEIKKWFDYYILGEDGGDSQAIELCLKDLTPPLKFIDSNKLTHESAKRIRKIFEKNILNGFNNFLSNLSPIRKLINTSLEVEKKALNKNDYTKFAFYKIKFGTSNAPESQLGEVDKAYRDIIKELKDSMRYYPEMLSNDIGMRAVVYVFSEVKKKLKELFIDSYNKDFTWEECGQILVPHINKVIEGNWFEKYESKTLDSKQKYILTNISFDKTGAVINYRLEDVPNGLGALITILCLSSIRDEKIIKPEEFEEKSFDYFDGLSKTLSKGYRKDVRGENDKKNFKGTPKEYDDMIKKETEKRTKQHIEKIKKLVNFPMK